MGSIEAADFGLSLRDATISDLPAVVAIYNSTVASRRVTADTEPATVASKQLWFAEHSPQGRPLWVLENEKGICGWTSFQSFYGRPAYKHTAEISIYLHIDYRGKGLGRFLLARAEESCPTLQIKTLLGFIFAHNAHSLALFERAGFQRWGLLPGIAELDGSELDLAIVGKRVAF